MRKKERSLILWYVGVGLFALLGIACFVVGYGLKDGWESVLAWFTSKWAMWVYVFAGIYGMAALAYFFYKKNKEYINGK